MKQLIKKLVEASGPSGFENDVLNAVKLLVELVSKPDKLHDR